MNLPSQFPDSTTQRVCRRCQRWRDLADCVPLSEEMPAVDQPLVGLVQSLRRSFEGPSPRGRYLCKVCARHCLIRRIVLFTTLGALIVTILVLEQLGVLPRR